MNKPTPKSKPHLVFAEWPNRSDAPGRLGFADYGSTVSSDSMWLALRLRKSDDDNYWLTKDANLMTNIGLWVWLSRDPDGTPRYVVEPRLREVFSATLDETEKLLAMLRKLVRKMPVRTGECSFRAYIADVAAALGIQHTVQYVPGRTAATGELQGSLAEYLHAVCTEFDRRVARCRP